MYLVIKVHLISAHSELIMALYGVLNMGLPAGRISPLCVNISVCVRCVHVVGSSRVIFIGYLGPPFASLLHPLSLFCRWCCQRDNAWSEVLFPQAGEGPAGDGRGQGPARPGSLLLQGQGEVQRAPSGQHDHPVHQPPGPAGQGHQYLLNAHQVGLRGEVGG